MAIEMGNERLFYAGFAAIKLLGYSAAGVWLNKIYSQHRNSFLVGLTRTVVGIAVGILVVMS